MENSAIIFKIIEAIFVAVIIYYFKKGSDNQQKMAESMHAIEIDIKGMSGNFKVYDEKLHNIDEKLEHNSKEIERVRERNHHISNELMKMSIKE